jgi:hypothetical protein
MKQMLKLSASTNFQNELAARLYFQVSGRACSLSLCIERGERHLRQGFASRSGKTMGIVTLTAHDRSSQSSHLILMPVGCNKRHLQAARHRKIKFVQPTRTGDCPQVRCCSTRPTRFLPFCPSQFHLSIFTGSIHMVSVECNYMLNLNVALRLLSGRLVGNHQNQKSVS